MDSLDRQNFAYNQWISRTPIWNQLDMHMASLSPFQICNKSNTTAVTCGAGTACTSEAPECIPGF